MKCRRSKGGCVDVVLWILPKCRQGGGGPKSQKLCRRHLSMAPKTDISGILIVGIFDAFPPTLR